MPNQRRAPKLVNTKIAIIVPSRGICYSETAEEIYREAELAKKAGATYKIFWSHGRKVPDCLNVPTNQALKNKSFTHFWYVDDDMYLPKGILVNLIQEDRHAIASDYPSSITMGAVVYDKDSMAYFTGSGCLLVKREVLEGMNKPIWRTDVGWRMKYLNDYIEFTACPEKEGDKVHGRHDVTFGLRLYAKGRPIYVSKIACGQRRADDFSIKQGNSSNLKINVWRKFHKNILYIPNNQSRQASFEVGDVVFVELEDGTKTHMKLSMAYKLDNIGKIIKWGHSVIKNWDVQKEEMI
jgi:hypothetical protein